MKELYLTPEMNIVDFAVEDIIATSVDDGTDESIPVMPSVGDNTTGELDPIP